MSSEGIASALRHISLFSGLSEEQLSQLERHTLSQHVARGEFIFSRGDQGDRAYVILSGAIDLTIDSPDGRELILARLGVGEHFGEMALVDDLARSASARAAHPTELVVVLRQAFMQAIRDDPDVSMEIIRSLVRRLRATDEKLEAFAYLDAEGRIARVVLDLHRQQTGTVAVTHEELAHMAATSRQTTTRMLDEWREQEYVTLTRRGITVRDEEALALLAGL
jgi:CRP/FNR family transcriptional regulator, cyclic AMP receptor protein